MCHKNKNKNISNLLDSTEKFLKVKSYSNSQLKYRNFDI